jgi:hypothetical protein
LTRNERAIQEKSMAMKKRLNHPDHVVDELIEGYVLANPRLVRKHPRVNAIIRADAPVAAIAALKQEAGKEAG